MAGPAIANGPDRVGGRYGVGGGGSWRRVAGGGPHGGADSQQVGAGQRWKQADLAADVYENEDGDKRRWAGRGVGRGPLWLEGGENRAKGFRQNAGWTGEFAEGQTSRAPPPRQTGAREREQVAAAALGPPAEGARGLLQVYRAMERMGEEVQVTQRFSVGRASECSLRLAWDGVSKQHLAIEARVLLPHAHQGERAGSGSHTAPATRRAPIAWFVTSSGTNGTFLNRRKLKNGHMHPLRDGDEIAIGKGAGVEAEGCADQDAALFFVYMFVFREPQGTPLPPHPPGSARAGGRGNSGEAAAAAAAAEAAARRVGLADPHQKLKGELHHPCKTPGFPPTKFAPTARDSAPAPIALELDFVYGYASGGRALEAARGNVFYNISGKVCYPAGTLGVVLDVRTQTQEFFREHDAPISVMAMHPNRRFVASGGVASARRMTVDGQPSVSVMLWDTTKSPPQRICKPLARQHMHAIHAMAFTTSGNYLITMGGTSKYSSRLVVYAWAAAGLKLPGEVPNKHELGILKLQDGLCLVPGGGQLSLTLCPNPYVSEAAVSEEIVRASGNLYAERPASVRSENRFDFLHCVDKSSRMYDMSKLHATPTRAARVMTGMTTPQKGLAAAWCPASWFPAANRPTDEVVAVGLELGDINLFQLVGAEITMTHKFELAHAGAVMSMTFIVMTPPGTPDKKDGEQYLVSGGRDGKVRFWDPKLSWTQPVMEFDIAALAADGTQHMVGVRALDYSHDKKALIAGTSTNEIYQISLGAGGGRMRCLVQAHFDTLLSIAAAPRCRVTRTADARGHRHAEPHPTHAAAHADADFVTTGLDGTLRFWNCRDKQQARCRVMGLPAHVCHISPDGRLLAVGHSGGQFSVWETQELQCIYINRHTSADIECLKFSPDGHALAVVCDRREIRLFDCTRYAVRAPRGQEEEYYGGANIKASEIQLRKDRFNFMLAHKRPSSAKGEAAKAPQAKPRVGNVLNPEAHARHLIRPEATGGIARKISAAPPMSEAPVELPAFKMLAARCKHAATITAMDFSADGRLLRSSDADGNLLLWQLPSLTPLAHVSEARDTQWASWSVPLAWQLKGMWSRGNILSDVSSTDVFTPHKATAVGMCVAKANLVTLFSFPCVASAPDRQVYGGHGARIAEVRWTVDGAYLISVGSIDQNICQWRVITTHHTHAAGSTSSGGHGARELEEVGSRSGPSRPHSSRPSFEIITRADD